jgi:hypothetical protein
MSSPTELARPAGHAFEARDPESVCPRIRLLPERDRGGDRLSAAVHSTSRRITTPSTGTGARMLGASIASIGLNEPYRDSSERARMDVALAANRGRVAELLGHILDHACD